MKVDPRNHCTKFTQSLPWALLHDLVAHPFMALTLYSKLAIRFHDYTSQRAWQRNKLPSVREFIARAQASGHDSFGIMNDPELQHAFDRDIYDSQNIPEGK